MFRRSGWRIGVGSVLACLVPLGGCANEPSAGEPPVVEIHVEDVRELALPLDAYLDVGGTGHDTMARAYQILFAKCMGRFGFDYEIPVATGISGEIIGKVRRYGVVDLDDARQYGYNPPPELSTAAKTSEPARTAAFVAVADGTVTKHDGTDVPAGGCVSDARRTLGAGAAPVEDERLGQMLAIKAFQLSEKDRRVTAVFAAWSSCMAKAGHDYPDASAPIKDPAFAGKTATSTEIAVATADVLCKQEVGLVNIWASVEVAYQKRLIDQNAESLALLLKMMDTRRRNAASVVAAAG